MHEIQYLNSISRAEEIQNMKNYMAFHKFLQTIHVQNFHRRNLDMPNKSFFYNFFPFLTISILEPISNKDTKILLSKKFKTLFFPRNKNHKNYLRKLLKNVVSNNYTNFTKKVYLECQDFTDGTSRNHTFSSDIFLSIQH